MNTNQAFAKTLYQWEKSRPDDLDRLCEYIDLDTVTLEIKGEKIQSSPAVSEVPDCIREIYRGFLNDWKTNTNTVETESVDTGSSVGNLTDFIIGVTESRR